MTDARVLRSRQGLRDVLVALLHEKPLDQITVREIAGRAGVGYTTFFRHYANKEALLDDLAAEEIARMTALTAPIYDAVDARAACLALCAYIWEHRTLWAALLAGAPGVVRDEMVRQGRAEAAARPGGSGLPTELAVALAAAVIVELMGWWLRQAEPWPAARVAEVLDRTVISPELGG